MNKRFSFIISGFILILLVIESDLSYKYFNDYDYFAIIFWLTVLYFVLLLFVFLIKKLIKKSYKVSIIIIITLFLILFVTKPLTLHNFNFYYRTNKLDSYFLYEKNSYGCAEALEYIYTDEENEYYFGCIMSENFLIKKGFDRFDIKEGLDKNKISIEQLVDLMQGKLKVEKKY